MSSMGVIRSSGCAAATRLSVRPRSEDRKSTRLNSSHSQISYAVFCLKKKKHTSEPQSQSNLVCRLLLEKKKKKFCNEIQSIRRDNDGLQCVTMLYNKMMRVDP